MTVFLVATRGVNKEVRVTTHPNELAAKSFLGSYGDEWSGHPIASDCDPDLSGPALVSLYNALAKNDPSHIDIKKFESRSVGKRRIWDFLNQAHQHKPHETAEAAPAVEKGDTPEAAQPVPGRDENEETDDMAAKKKAAKKAAKKTTKPAGEKKPRGKGKSAGKVADFRPVREGTDRQKVLKLMNGQNTAEQIGTELDMPAKKVGTIVFCMSRDNGIGYEFGPKGQLKALFPGSNTYKDAVKAAKSE